MALLYGLLVPFFLFLVVESYGRRDWWRGIATVLAAVGAAALFLQESFPDVLPAGPWDLVFYSGPIMLGLKDGLEAWRNRSWFSLAGELVFVGLFLYLAAASLWL